MKARIYHSICRGTIFIVIIAALLVANVQSALAVAPSNDLFSGATLIDSDPFNDSIVGVTGSATPQPGDAANGEPLISCNNNFAGLATVWYRFNATENGILDVDTRGSTYDTVAAIWLGTSLSNLTLVSCNNNYYSPITESFASAYVRSGNTYYIEIAQAGGVSGAGNQGLEGVIAATDPVYDLSLEINFTVETAVESGYYDDRDVNWNYIGAGWLHPDAIGAYANTHSYSDTIGDAAELYFVGDQFKLYYTTANDGGHLQIWIDNVLRVVIEPSTLYLDQYSGSTNYQWTWLSPVLSQGAHKVHLENETGRVYVDAINVTNQVAPLGDISDNYTPTYQWNEVPSSTWYHLYVNGPSGKVLEEWYQASAICSIGLCSITPDVPLGGGAHSWWVQTYNSVGLGPWSSAKLFSTAIPTLPGAATQNLPVGDIGTDYTPTYEWNEVPGATWYHLYVNGPSGNVLDKWYTATQAACDGSTCSVTPSVTLGGGAHSWWIQTYNSAGLGPWSSGLSFNTTSTVPAAAAQVYPEGDIGADYTPTYEWSDVSDATWYRLYVNGPSGNVVDEWYSTTEAACDGLNCSVTPDTPLGGGTHSWWVQTYSSIGYGPWSSGMSFTTTAHTVPDAATQNLPVGDIGTDYTPTYEWNEVPGATWYHLYVNGPSGNVLDEWYTATQAACDGFTCSVTPSVTLGGGAHSWWIQTYNSAGLGPWSSGLSFNTTIPTPPGPVP